MPVSVCQRCYLECEVLVYRQREQKIINQHKFRKVKEYSPKNQVGDNV